MIDQKRQPPLKQVILTGLLTVSLAGFSTLVIAQPSGTPEAECEEALPGSVPYAKYEWNGEWGQDPPPPPPIVITFTPVPHSNISGTWTSVFDTEIDAMVVKAATERDVTIYDPPVTSGTYDNLGPNIEGKHAISHITFCVKEGGGGTENKGVCVLDFDKPANYGPNYPLYFNDIGSFEHDLDLGDTGRVEKLLSCYQNKTQEWCKDQLDKYLNPPDATVTSTHWYNNVDTCDDLRAAGVLPPEDQVKLLATGVDLTAKLIGNGQKVKLKLTTTAEPDTAELLILRGENRENGGTEVEVACEFPSGGSPYRCTDDSVADSYRAAEKEYDGSFIVYDEVTPK